MANQQPLDTFDYVVVLMLENRSFDNILGYLYPAGTQFDGVAGKNLTNPDENGNPVPVSTGTDFHQPYPDPGEQFNDITCQLFNNGTPPTCTATGTPTMQGFVKDYFSVLSGLTKWCGSPADQSKVIMQCFAPSSIPVLSALATQFAVFDQWFCAVPSQTWCNRAFWHAATSWGWVNNPRLSGDATWDLDKYAVYSSTPTLFDLLETKFGVGSWRVYEDLPVPFTKLVHWGDLKDKSGEDYFRYFEFNSPFFKNFFADCAGGNLPKYSFVEPHFINFLDDVVWHDDMHPSSFDSPLYSDGGPGSVLLGDQIVWKVYQAIRNSQSTSGNNWQNTLLIITFDEHGGCYDHVPPLSATPPDKSQFNNGGIGQDNFGFDRLGVRVPMVMVSANIAANTIVNSPMHHCSFLQTMQQKWGLTSLGPRQTTAPPFTEVFSPTSRGLETFPDWPVYPGPSSTLNESMMAKVDPSDVPLNDLQKSILEAMYKFYVQDPVLSTLSINTAADAKLVLEAVEKFRHLKL